MAPCDFVEGLPECRRKDWVVKCFSRTPKFSRQAYFKAHVDQADFKLNPQLNGLDEWCGTHDYPPRLGSIPILITLITAAFRSAVALI